MARALPRASDGCPDGGAARGPGGWLRRGQGGAARRPAGCSPGRRRASPRGAGRDKGKAGRGGRPGACGFKGAEGRGGAGGQRAGCKQTGVTAVLRRSCDSYMRPRRANPAGSSRLSGPADTEHGAEPGEAARRPLSRPGAPQPRSRGGAILESRDSDAPSSQLQRGRRELGETAAPARTGVCEEAGRRRLRAGGRTRAGKTPTRDFRPQPRLGRPGSFLGGGRGPPTRPTPPPAARVLQDLGLLRVCFVPDLCTEQGALPSAAPRTQDPGQFASTAPTLGSWARRSLQARPGRGAYPTAGAAEPAPYEKAAPGPREGTAEPGDAEPRVPGRTRPQAHHAAAARAPWGLEKKRIRLWNAKPEKLARNLPAPSPPLRAQPEAGKPLQATATAGRPLRCAAEPPGGADPGMLGGGQQARVPSRGRGSWEHVGGHQDLAAPAAKARSHPRARAGRSRALPVLSLLLNGNALAEGGRRRRGEWERVFGSRAAGRPRVWPLDLLDRWLSPGAGRPGFKATRPPGAARLFWHPEAALGSVLWPGPGMPARLRQEQPARGAVGGFQDPRGPTPAAREPRWRGEPADQRNAERKGKRAGSPGPLPPRAPLTRGWAPRAAGGDSGWPSRPTRGSAGARFGRCVGEGSPGLADEHRVGICRLVSGKWREPGRRINPEASTDAAGRGPCLGFSLRNEGSGSPQSCRVHRCPGCWDLNPQAAQRGPWRFPHPGFPDLPSSLERRQPDAGAPRSCWDLTPGHAHLHIPLACTPHSHAHTTHMHSAACVHTHSSACTRTHKHSHARALLRTAGAP
ncbi:collagen alpha-1(I) chain-like [Choloepus didactylus]|uniref:collagen alpha-1(I) chain-like n=1 Tax=Choloepus didactylus TaxID=27675 RepID=UPI00189E6FC1|nr:collagen alpha-1(I) chain-like [Choloepus didactylus]